MAAAEETTSAQEARDEAPKGSTFPLVRGRRRGYGTEAVDAFLSGARRSFESGDRAINSGQIRRASFPIVRGGYDIDAVDAALGRLEDAFAARERADGIERRGPDDWVSEARSIAQEILERLSRPRTRRFARTGFLAYGYHVAEVDHVAGRIVGYLRDGDALTADQVRSVAFRMQRRGYREEQVDALLDATIEVILAVR